jgi:hypothetical protein
MATQLDDESPAPPLLDPDSAMQHRNYSLIDQGGCGDCAFRAICDSMWWNDEPAAGATFSLEDAKKPNGKNGCNGRRSACNPSLNCCNKHIYFSS